MWKSVFHVRSTRIWWMNWSLKKKIVTMYSYVARPPVAQSFVISMITTIITMNVKERVTPWFTLDRIDKMVCECGMTPTLSLTQSETNYGKMYLQCNQRHCKLFTWWRFKPKRTVQILTYKCEWFISGLDVKMTFTDLLEALFPIIRRKQCESDVLIFRHRQGWGTWEGCFMGSPINRTLCW